MKIELNADLLSSIQKNNSKIGKDDYFDMMLQNNITNNSKNESNVEKTGLFSSINEINNMQKVSTSLMEDVLAGKSDNTHGALIALEKADMQMQYAVTVRDKVIQGTQSILNMQI